MLAFILMLTVHPTFGLVGYDCAGPSLNITTISLNEIGNCKIPLIEPIPVPTRVQLLQLSEFTSASVVQCKVEIDRTIYYCGMHSHISIVQNGRQVYLHEMDEQACTRMQETGIIQLSVSGQMVGLKKNSTTTRSITLAGFVSNDGRCSGTQYSDLFGGWDNVVVQATVKIVLTNYNAAANLQTGKIILQSGTHCPLHEGFCEDTEGNRAFWQTEPMETCEFSRYDVLFEGQAVKLLSIENGIKSPDIYTLTTQETTFALAATSEKNLCGYTLRRTEHPKLYILEIRNGESFTRRKKISVNNLDIFTYMNSKFIYVEKHIKTQIKNLYKSVLTQRCELEKQVLQNALSTAAILPEKFARAVMKMPGYMAVVAGEVAHIIKCIPVECTLRRSTECYDELPVTHKNRSFFLSTISKTLIRSGTQVECDPQLPAQYMIDGNWYRFTPHPIVVPAPQILEPNSLPLWEYSSVGNIGSSGIYTNEEINQLRERIMFPAEKPALLNNIARGSAGHAIPSGSVSLRNLFDEDTLNHLAESTIKRFWNGFEKFGTASAGIFAIFFIVTIIKAVLDTCIHGFTLHSIYGWSFALIGAVWNSVTNLLITRAHTRYASASKAPLQEILVTTGELLEDENNQQRLPEANPVVAQQHRGIASD